MTILGPLLIKDKRLRSTEAFLGTLLNQHGLSSIHPLRIGPRYYVAEARQGKTPVIFKSCLFPGSTDHLTNEKFGREVLFLSFLQHSRHTLVRKTAPHVYAAGTRPRAWYIREYIGGATQNVKGGDIRFVPSFFSATNARWIVRFFSALQNIREHELPKEFRALLYRPNFAAQLLKFMTPHWHTVEKNLEKPAIVSEIKRYFKKNAKLYDTTRRVLVHQEPYAVHLIKQSQGWRLIDWENIGWGNAVHDYLVVWMRASRYPAWQNSFRTLVKRQATVRQFDKLWELEQTIQSVFNVISWQFITRKHDMRELYLFSKKFLLQKFS
ncbi:MAG: phosphotransferase [Patescibacteria group bacterium]|jgi:hypothetical protein